MTSRASPRRQTKQTDTGVSGKTFHNKSLDSESCAGHDPLNSDSVDSQSAAYSQSESSRETPVASRLNWNQSPEESQAPLWFSWTEAAVAMDTGGAINACQISEPPNGYQGNVADVVTVNVM